MKEVLPNVYPGDPIRAKDQTRVNKLVTELEASGPPAGQQGVDIGGVRATANKAYGPIMVRMLADVVPEKSSQFDTAKALYPDGPDGFNCVMQVWDTVQKRWTDEPGGTKYEVCVPDDGGDINPNKGWRPLIKNAIIPIQWNKTASRYFPLEAQESAVVMVTAPSSGGLAPGTVYGYDSDNKAWFVLGECWVADQ